MTDHLSQPARWSALAVVLALAAAGCSSTSAADEATEQQLASQLVAATEAAGVAPRLTVDVAEALYGTDASAVCEAFADGPGTAARTVLFGNAAQGRRKVITDEAVTYAGLVVQTYCPDVLVDFDEAVQDLDPFETTD